MTTRMRVAKIPKEELERRCADGSMYADFVPIGKWIDTKPHLNSPMAKQYKCDQCGYWALKSNFCPFCGADMREDGVDATEN